MIHTLFVMIWTVLATLVFGILAILISFRDPAGSATHRVARAWAKSILMAARIRVQVSGLANLDPTSPYIYMCNHQSNFDIPILLAHLSAQFRWLAKAELFRIPFFGLAMKRAGYIGIDRKNRQSAIASLKKAAEIVRKGSSIIIFPEGTRSPDGNISPFKKGGFMLALDAGVPIVPVILHGTRAIMAKKRLRIEPGAVDLQITTPVDTSGYDPINKEALISRIRTIICDAFYSDRTKRT